jgi:hypothetical protein
MEPAIRDAVVDCEHHGIAHDCLDTESARYLLNTVDALRAALAVRAELAVVSPEDSAFLDAAIELWQANERVCELDAESGALQRDRDRLDESMRRFMRAGNAARLAEAKRDAHPAPADAGVNGSVTLDQLNALHDGLKKNASEERIKGHAETARIWDAQAAAVRAAIRVVKGEA